MDRVFLLLGGAALLTACSGAPDTAAKNRTFYDWTVATSGDASAAAAFEQRYPPLDLAGAPPMPEYLGYTVLRGGVHLSRPKNWMLRDANNEPAKAVAQYISPNAYTFALYERPDSPLDPWRDVIHRYERDVKASGATIAGGRVPLATAIGQGRAYTIEREVEAAKRPLVSRSREVLLRGEHRIVLVQVVHEGEDLSAVDRELLRVFETLEVL